MSLILTGNSSTLTVDSTNGITFPVGSGAQVAPGKILQVVQTTYGSVVSTSSTSYVASGAAANITPLVSTSKILVSVYIPLYQSVGNNGVGVSIYKNGSLLFDPSGTNSGVSGTFSSFNAGSAYVATTAFQYLDSPATTSSTNYAIYFCNYQGGLTYAQYGTGTASKSIVTLMEVAA